MQNSFITIKNLVKNYEIGDIIIPALCGVDVSLNKGMFIVVLGPSGCGKTTFLNLLGGIDKVTKGSIKINGQEITELDEKGFTKYRKEDVGFIFQFYNLIPTLTSLENVELAARLKFPSKEAYNHSLLLLKQVGLSELEIKKFPNQLSGGQQQRVAIARALVKIPKIVLADEPTGNLDTDTSGIILNLMKTIAKEHETTFIVVTHNLAISKLADKVIYLRDGQISKEILENKLQGVV